MSESLFKLPVELRYLVYHEVLDNLPRMFTNIQRYGPRICHGYRTRYGAHSGSGFEGKASFKDVAHQWLDCQQSSRTSISLLGFCRQIYNEALQICYGNRMWSVAVSLIELWYAFSCDIGSINHEHIRMLRWEDNIAALKEERLGNWILLQMLGQSKSLETLIFVEKHPSCWTDLLIYRQNTPLFKCIRAWVDKIKTLQQV